MIPKIRVNMSKIVTESETENLKLSSDKTPIASGGYPGPLIVYLWDKIPFVKAPGNYTIFVKYDHDDNNNKYDEYPKLHPLEFSCPWEIPPGKYGDEKLHTHMAISDVYDWKTGARSEEEIFRKYVKGTQLGVSILGIGLVALIAWKFGCFWLKDG